MESQPLRMIWLPKPLVDLLLSFPLDALERIYRENVREGHREFEREGEWLRGRERG